MTTGQDQTQTLHEAADRTRSGVGRPALRARHRRGASSPSGPTWPPTSAATTRRAVRAAGGCGSASGSPAPRSCCRTAPSSCGAGPGAVPQIIPRKRPGGVAAGRRPVRRDHPLDRLPAAPQRARQALRGHRWTSRRRSPTRCAPTPRPQATAVLDDRDDGAVPALLRRVDEGADICPHCGRYLGDKPKRSKKFWLILALLLLLLVAADRRRDPAADRRRERAGGRAEAHPHGLATAEAGAEPHRRTRSAASPARAGRAGPARAIRRPDRSAAATCRSASCTGPDGAVIRIFHTPKEKANPGTFEAGKRKPLKTQAADSELATVKNFGAPSAEAATARTCSSTTPPGAASRSPSTPPRASGWTRRRRSPRRSRAQIGRQR